MTDWQSVGLRSTSPDNSQPDYRKENPRTAFLGHKSGKASRVRKRRNSRRSAGFAKGGNGAAAGISELAPWTGVEPAA